MHITHLSLVNFRNYLNLEFDFPQNTSIFWGRNAQGKTNLLESICFLATTRFSHNVPEKEIIHWNALQEPIPLARIGSDMEKGDRSTQLEIILRPRSMALPRDEIVALNKHIKVNGLGRKSVDFIGLLNAVMFSPRDIDLISKEPSLRRRYLDITNCQIDRRYLRSLQRYNSVLSRRNHLLRHVAAGYSRPEELEFWDEEMIKNGAYLISQRSNMIATLEMMAAPIHYELSGGKEMLTLRYVSKVKGDEHDSLERIEQAFQTSLSSSRERDLIRGQSLVGPHRDDIQFFVNEINMGSYGSRGQQRTIALSIKLAEARFILSRTGETPVILLDDVLSELDSQRRAHLLSAISGYQQVLITATDLDHFPADFLERAEVFEVVNGQIMK